MRTPNLASTLAIKPTPNCGPGGKELGMEDIEDYVENLNTNPTDEFTEGSELESGDSDEDDYKSEDESEVTGEQLTSDETDIEDIDIEECSFQEAADIVRQIREEFEQMKINFETDIKPKQIPNELVTVTNMIPTTEEPDYESDFDVEPEATNSEDENETISTEEDSSIVENQNSKSTTISNSSAAARKQNQNQTKKSEEVQNNNNNETNGSTEDNEVQNGSTEPPNDNNQNGKEHSDTSESEIESDINDNDNMVRSITEEFHQMKMKFNQEDIQHDIEMEYTVKREISGKQKYYGSSTDTNTEENVHRHFEVEVVIENYPRQDSVESEENEEEVPEQNENSEKKDESSDEEELSEENESEDESEDNETDSNQEDDNAKDEEGVESDKKNHEKQANYSDEKPNSETYEEVKENNDKESEDVLVEETEPIADSAISEEQQKLETIEDVTNAQGDIQRFDNKLENNIEIVEKLVFDNKTSSFRSENNSFSMEISTKRPSSFNSEDYPFQLSFVNKRNTPDLKKINQNKNLSFTNERMREIERSNQVLLRKILTQKSSYESKNLLGNKPKTVMKNNRQTSAAINRKKQQRQIDIDNQVLKRKLEAIAYRNRMH